MIVTDPATNFRIQIAYHHQLSGKEKAFHSGKACNYFEHTSLHTSPLKHLFLIKFCMFYFFHCVTKVGRKVFFTKYAVVFTMVNN